MAESLFDFGNIAQLAQGNLRNAMQIQQMDLQGRQTAVNEQELQLHQKQQETARLNSMREIWQDPRVQNDEHLSDQLFSAMAPMVGIPTEHLQENLTQSRQDRMKLMTATLGNDPQAATAATVKLMAGLPPDKAAVFLKNIESLPGLHAKAQQAKQIMEMNETKFADLRQKQAVVNEGRGPLTALSSIMRDHLSGTDTSQFKAMQNIFAQTGHTKLLESSDKTFNGKSKEAVRHLLDGNTAKMADNLQPEIDRVKYLLETDQRALKDMDHGVKQPGHMKEALNARIATNGPILGALRDMQEWYRDPLSKEKHAAAKDAYKSIEGRRVELEAMDKKLDTERMNLVNLANEKFDYKQGQDSSIALGQQEYFALPDNKRTGQAAARIAAKITQDTGVPVKVSDITKDPNAPQSVNKTEVHVGDKAGVKLAENAIEQLKESHGNAMGANDILDGVGRIEHAISKGNVTLGPGATIRNSLSQVANLFGVQGANQEERLVNTRETMRGLAQFAVNARKLLRGQGSVTENEQKILIRAESGEIEDFTLPEIKTFLATTKRLANKSLSNHQRMMEIARKKPELQGYLDFYEVPALASGKGGQGEAQSSAPSGKAVPSQGGAVLKSLPQGSKQIGTAGGKPVYQGPDGKKWIGE